MTPSYQFMTSTTAGVVVLAPKWHQNNYFNRTQTPPWTPRDDKFEYPRTPLSWGRRHEPKALKFPSKIDILHKAFSCPAVIL